MSILSIVFLKCLCSSTWKEADTHTHPFHSRVQSSNAWSFQYWAQLAPRAWHFSQLSMRVAGTLDTFLPIPVDKWGYGKADYVFQRHIKGAITEKQKNNPLFSSLHQAVSSSRAPHRGIPWKAQTSGHLALLHIGVDQKRKTIFANKLWGKNWVPHTWR